MNDIQKTFSAKESDIEKNWLLVDAEGKILGRLATELASIIRGKNKPTYTPHMDMGDNVVVINADKIVLTGKKSEDKEYFKHTEFPGGKKFLNIEKVMSEKPEFVIEHAVKGMLPKTKLGRKMIKNLKVYAGTDHPHTAQMPKTIKI